MMFWYYHGHLSEGAARIGRALAAAANVEVPPLVRAQALVCQGLLAQTRGDAALGLSALDEGARLRELGGDEPGALVAQGLRGGLLVSEGRYDDAAPIFERNVLRLRALNRPVWVAHALFHLGVIAFARGDGARAAELCAESAALYSANSRLDAIDPLRYLGLIACATGEVERAAGHFAETLALLDERGSPAALSTGLADIATLAISRGQAQAAATLFGAADALRVRHGASYSLPARDVYEAAMARARDALGSEMNAGARASGSELSLPDALAIANAVLHPAPVAPAGADWPEDVLTPRELEVLRLVVAGLTNPEIGDRLFISRGTARTHVSNILTKLGAHTRTEAATIAREHGLLDAGS
jgi:DNA-binding CsgD family transcriptional regulator